MYSYRISDVRVIDGDTIECTMDLGFRIYIRQRIRFYGINTAEMNSRDPELREHANAAKDYVEAWFRDNPIAVVYTTKSDSFGRWLGTIYPVDPDIIPKSLNQILLDKNLAEHYRP